MKVLVIVVTYNGKRWYERCFNSLRQSTLPVDVYVVDNASVDGSADWIAEHYPEVILVRSNKNLGFGQANNKGMRYALDHGYDYVFLLNQDAWFMTADAMENLITVAEAHPEFALYSPMQHYASGLMCKGFANHIKQSTTDTNDYFSDLQNETLKDIYAICYVCAASWLLPRRTLETVGGFDPIFFHYGEDDNYIHRLEYFKKQICFTPTSHLIHDAEYRPQNYGKENNNWKKDLLMELTDVNINSTVNKKICRSMLKSILLLRFSRFIRYYHFHKYIIHTKKAVAYSRQQNVKIGATWL